MIKRWAQGEMTSLLGNSPRIAQQSYLLVTEDDFAKAAGGVKVMVER